MKFDTRGFNTLTRTLHEQRLLIYEVRKLHGPVDGIDLICDGCSYGGAEPEPPWWPCATAALVYTKAEIDDIKATHKSWQKWIRARDYRKRMARGWTTADDHWLALRQKHAPHDVPLYEAFPLIPAGAFSINYRVNRGFTPKGQL